MTRAGPAVSRHPPRRRPARARWPRPCWPRRTRGGVVVVVAYVDVRDVGEERAHRFRRALFRREVQRGGAVPSDGGLGWGTALQPGPDQGRVTPVVVAHPLPVGLGHIAPTSFLLALPLLALAPGERWCQERRGAAHLHGHEPRRRFFRIGRFEVGPHLVGPAGRGEERGGVDGGAGLGYALVRPLDHQLRVARGRELRQIQVHVGLEERPAGVMQAGIQRDQPDGLLGRRFPGQTVVAREPDPAHHGAVQRGHPASVGEQQPHAES